MHRRSPQRTPTSVGPPAIHPPRRHRLTVVCVAALALVATACGSTPDTRPVLPLDGPELQQRSAEAMAAVGTVRFELTADGDDVFIDPLETLALVDVVGRFSVPATADALLTVEVNSSLSTQLGAIAIGSEAWLSNPITGDFEPLPESYGLDPSRFFDPEGGWRPLIENLTDVETIGTDDDGHHLRAIAAGTDIRRVTAGLAAGEDTPVELWLDTRSAEVTRARFTTTVAGATTDWELRLSEYGAEVSIEPPDVAGG